MDGGGDRVRDGCINRGRGRGKALGMATAAGPGDGMRISFNNQRKRNPQLARAHVLRVASDAAIPHKYRSRS
eukprot:10378529-Prorocentrum_lima.AAC.1